MSDCPHADRGQRNRCVCPDDGSAVEVLYRAYGGRLDGVSLEAFRRTAAGWELALLMAGAEVVGAATRRGGELHIGILPDWRKRWATRGFIRDIIAWAAESGPVRTGVMHGNAIGKRLVEGVGFVPVETRKKGVLYALPR